MPAAKGQTDIKAKASKMPPHPFALDPSEIQSKLAETTTAINKRFGAGTMDTAANKAADLTIHPLPTPSLKLNAILDGGFMEGRMIELFGKESSGKTFLTYEVIAYDMKAYPGSVWLWCETEGSYNESDAKMMGVDTNRLHVTMLGDKGAEELLDIMEAFIRQLSEVKGLLRGVVVNSVAGLTPVDELNTVHSQQHMGLQARMMSKHMRKINAIAHRTKCTIIYINQIRENIGAYGSPTTTSGGRALRFYSSQRIELRKASESKANWDTLRMMKIDVKVHKNRLSRTNPYKTTSMYAVYGQGIDSGIEIAELAVASGLIQRGGAWYTYKGQKFNGNMKLLEYINTNPDIKQELYDTIYESFIRTTDINLNEQQAIQAAETAETAEFNNIEYEEAVNADQLPIE